MGVLQSLERKREEDEQKNDQKRLKFRGDLAEGKRNVQHQKHKSALRALKNNEGMTPLQDAEHSREGDYKQVIALLKNV